MENIADLTLKILGIYGAIFAPVATSPENIERWVSNTFCYGRSKNICTTWNRNDFVKFLGIELYFLYFLIDLRTPLIQVFGPNIEILTSSFKYYSCSFTFLFLLLHLFLPNLSELIKCKSSKFFYVVFTIATIILALPFIMIAYQYWFK